MEKASNFNFRFQPDIRKALEKQAEETDRTLGYLINLHLRNGLIKAGYLKKDPKK